jgi:hypothetical protein
MLKMRDFVKEISKCEELEKIKAVFWLNNLSIISNFLVDLILIVELIMKGLLNSTFLGLN